MEGEVAEVSEVSEQIDFDKTRDLNLVDHMLIGSSVPGSGFNSEEFRRQLESGGLSEDALRPLGYEFPLSKDEVQEIEDRRKKQLALKGMLPFLGDEQFSLPPGYTFLLQPIGDINAETGAADPLWRVAVVDSEGKMANNFKDNITLMHEPGLEFTDHLDLVDESPGSKLLRIKTK